MVLGVAYKKDIDDPRESPSTEVLHLLAQRGASITYHDPHIPHFTEHGHDLRSVPLTSESLRLADLVVILTDHSAVDYTLVVKESAQILDTRNALKRVDGPKPNVVLL
jgi:UDP-N-acetyl-D-glucosamine dehydrogenase